MRNRSLIFIVIAVVVVLAAFGYFYWLQQEPSSVPVTEEQSLPAPPVAAESESEEGQLTQDEDTMAPSTPQSNGVSTTPAMPSRTEPVQPQPLFAVDSTALAEKNFTQWLSSHTNTPALKLVATDGMIERLVATVDSINRDELAYRLLPVERPEGSYQSIEVEQHLYPANTNHRRYSDYLELASTFDVDTWVDLYVTLYPRLEAQYQRLGYPEGNFNEVVKGALRKLVATPDVSHTPQLVQPKVTYQFADPALEQLPPAQKLILRLDRDSRKQLLGRLSDLLKAIDALPASRLTNPQQ